MGTDMRRALIHLGLTVMLAAWAATLYADEPARVQRAQAELEALKSIAADVTNVAEQALWTTRIQLAEKEVENARKLAALEAREQSLSSQHSQTARDALQGLLREVEPDTDAALKRVREHDRRIRYLTGQRVDRSADLKSTTGETEEAAQRRADLEQAIRNLDAEIQAERLERDKEELSIRLARDAVRIDEYVRAADTPERATISHMLEKKRDGREARRAAAAYEDQRANLQQERDSVAEALAIGRERFDHLDEEIGTLDTLYQAVRKPLFSLKQADARQVERQRVMRGMLADARSQHKTLDERLKDSQRQLQALDASIALASQARDLQAQFAEYMSYELRQLADRFLHRVSVPAIIIAGLIALYFLLTRVLLPFVLSRDSLFVSRRMGTYLLGLLIVLVLAVSFLDDLRAIATVLGIAGAAVVIALQDLCSAFAGWFVIISSGKLRVGDRVEIDGHGGDIIDIQLLRTTLLEVDNWLHSDVPTGRVVIVPNSFIFKSKVFNYSHMHPFIWDKVDLVLQFESPVQEAHILLDRALREETNAEFEAARSGSKRVERTYGMEDAVYEPRVHVTLDTSGTKFSLLYVTHYRQVDEVHSRLVRRVLTDLSGDPRMRLAYVTVRQPPENSSLHSAVGASRA